MRKYITLVALLLTCCSPSVRTMDILTVEENNRLSYILSSRENCFNNKIKSLDDGRSDLEQIAEIVVWSCRNFNGEVKNLLEKDFNIGIGDSWSYINNMQKAAPKRVVEGILAYRKIINSSKNTTSVFKR